MFLEVFTFGFLLIWIYFLLVFQLILKTKRKTPPVIKLLVLIADVLIQLLWISMKSFFISHQSKSCPSQLSFHHVMVNAKLWKCNVKHIYLFEQNRNKNQDFLSRTKTQPKVNNIIRKECESTRSTNCKMCHYSINLCTQVLFPTTLSLK